MPSPKRYFHCSQDLPFDHEIHDMMKEVGAKSILVWLALLAALDRVDNRLQLAGTWMTGYRHKCNTQVTVVRHTYDYAIKCGWIREVERDTQGKYVVIEATNFWKYNRKREQRGDEKGTQPTPSTQPLRPSPSPTPTPYHSEPYQEKEALKMPTIDEIVKTAIQSVLTKPHSLSDAPPPTPQANAPLSSSVPLVLTEKLKEQVIKLGILKPEVELKAFLLHTRKHGKAYADYEAAFYSWCLKALQGYGQPQKSTTPNGNCLYPSCGNEGKESYSGFCGIAHYRQRGRGLGRM